MKKARKDFSELLRANERIERANSELARAQLMAAEHPGNRDMKTLVADLTESALNDYRVFVHIALSLRGYQRWLASQTGAHKPATARLRKKIAAIWEELEEEGEYVGKRSEIIRKRLESAGVELTRRAIQSHILEMGLKKKSKRS